MAGSTGRSPRRPNAKYLKKAPSPVQEEFATYIEKTTGHTVPSGDVALVQRLYPLFLKSPAVVKAREAEKAERERVAAERKAAKETRLKERLAAIEEQRQRVLRELGIETDDETVPHLSAVPDSGSDGDDDSDEEPQVVTLTDEDEFVEGEPDDGDDDADENDPDDDDDWGDDTDEEEDF